MKWQGSCRMRSLWVGAILWVWVAGAGSANAEIIMSEPANLGPVINDAYDVQESDFSHDGLQLYFAVWGGPNGFGSGDIYMAERETLHSPWQEPVNLGSNVNSSACEIEPSISSDGLELYFGSWDDWYIRVCKRPSQDAPWSSPVKIGPPIGYDAYGPDISADGLSLYFTSKRGGGYGGHDIWVTRRATTIDPWTEPVNLGPNVNSGATDWSPSMSTDGLTLVFSRGFGSICATTRKSIDDDWEPAVRLEISGPGNFFSPALLPDSSTLYFQAVNAWGGYGANDFWEVTFAPAVDFDADGIVDAGDMFIMVDNWHAHGTLCDIAPLPVGDGYVDVKDLLVLAEYLERGDPTLIAHWALDEMEGIAAQDSAGAHHGTVMGTAVWHPDAGMIDGALELDGSTFVVTDHVLSPPDDPFSVLAWIKGGGPGQVIISQQEGVNWLAADASAGVLSTGLQGSRRGAGPLVSDAGITDGFWHRVAFTWDGVCRSLYVDGTLVAEDEQGSLTECRGGLNIGCGANLAPGSFFSGLIDDVRIYDRAIQP